MIMVLFDSVTASIKKGPHGLFRVGLSSLHYTKVRAAVSREILCRTTSIGGMCVNMSQQRKGFIREAARNAEPER